MPLPPVLPAPLPLAFHGEAPADARVLTWGKADPWVALGIVGVLAPGALLYPAPDPGTLAPGTLHAGDTLRDGPFTMTLTVSEPWRAVSDVLGYGTGFGLAAVVVPYEIGGDGWVRRDLGRAGIALESTVTTLALTTVLKKVAARPRPYTHVAPDELGAIGSVGEEALAEQGEWGDSGWVWTDPDAVYSWPSGHTSGVAGGAFAVTTIALYSQPERRPVDYLWYAVPTALTATTGYARVRATKHHPTDVISGGLLGAACGILLPLAHVRGEGGPRLALTAEGAFLAGEW